ncbi:MAG: hypothetical protein AAGF49_01445 [Pseudomonadota bacterium]
MFENKPHRAATADVEMPDFQTPAGPRSDRPPGAVEFEIDSELQAAIEYKIAASGLHGAEVVLDLLNIALRRHVA